MPVFEINDKKVCYGLSQEDGKVLLDTEDILDALGYSPEVAGDIKSGAAADILAEIDDVVFREFGPDGREVHELPLGERTIRVCGPKRDGGAILVDDKVCLTDALDTTDLTPGNNGVWVEALEFIQFTLTRIATSRSKVAVLDGVPVRSMSDPFRENRVVYSVDDIIAAITGEPPDFDEGWMDEKPARKLIKTLHRGQRVFKATGKVPDKKATSEMLKDDQRE